MATSMRSGAVPGSAAPAACTMRPQLGSPPCSAAFTSGELATARATRSIARVAAAHDDAPDARGTLAVADDLERELAQQASSAWPKRSSPSDSGSTAMPLAPEHCRIRCRWWTAGRRRRCGRTSASRTRRAAGRRSRAEHRVGLHEAQHRREAGWIIPAPLACAARRTVPSGSVTSTAARFSNMSVVMIAAGSRRRRRRAAPRAPRQAAHHGVGGRAGRRSRRSRRPRPGPRSRRPPSRRRPASRRPVEPGPPVAALALPEFTATARSASSRARSRVTSTGAAAVPERGEARGARGVRRRRRRAGRRRARRSGLMPAATPAARKPAGSRAAGDLGTPSGASTQRERKNGRPSRRGPRSRRGRT